jgi:hypothetical protein
MDLSPAPACYPHSFTSLKRLKCLAQDQLTCKDLFVSCLAFGADLPDIVKFELIASSFHFLSSFRGVCADLRKGDRECDMRGLHSFSWRRRN